METIKNLLGALLALFLLTVVVAGYFAPTIIALARKHHYKWVIFAINLVFGLSGMGYLVALVWAVWPRETAVVDTVANDVTTNAAKGGGTKDNTYDRFREEENNRAPNIIPHCGEKHGDVAAKRREHDVVTDEKTKNSGNAPEEESQPDDEMTEANQVASDVPEREFGPLIGRVHKKDIDRISYNPGKPWFMFILMNSAVCLSVMIITLGNAKLALWAVLLGAVGPFIMLMLSKCLAKMSFDIKEIDPKNFENSFERQLYHLVKTLSLKAGLKSVPEVGIYESPDMNAFATGAGPNSSLVVFSSALAEKMDEEAVAAVAAHEIAHVANGDMLSMTIMQSVVNVVVIALDMALFFALDDDDDNFAASIAKTVLRWVLVGICMFLGNLLLLWYSRHREFKADALAARLVDPDAMIGALNKLREDESLEIPAEVAESQKSYAAFKISNKSAPLDLFSTHPSIERRVERLKRSTN